MATSENPLSFLVALASFVGERSGDGLDVCRHDAQQSIVKEQNVNLLPNNVLLHPQDLYFPQSTKCLVIHVRVHHGKQYNAHPKKAPRSYY